MPSRDALLILGGSTWWRSANETFYTTFKVDPAATEGRLVYELGNGQWDIPRLRELLEKVLPGNDAFDDFVVEHDFEEIGRRVMVLNARKIDHLELILLAIEDVTERLCAERERELLIRELSHRVKNVFAVVQALATQTDGRMRSVEAYREAFLGRLRAMARTHGMVLDADWRGTELGALVGHAVEAYRADRPQVVAIEGEPIPLTPAQSLALSLVLHELGTNAAKFGALSNHEGHVRALLVQARGSGKASALALGRARRPPDHAADGKGFVPADRAGQHLSAQGFRGTGLRDRGFDLLHRVPRDLGTILRAADDGPWRRQYPARSTRACR